jgi:hypothetical protein
MTGKSLNLNSTLECPHGGKVVITSTNVQTSGGSAKLVTNTDQFKIVGCPFQIPTTPPIPSPCISILWLIADGQVRVKGSFTLGQSSIGLCLSSLQIPQGAVVIKNTQTDVASR